MKIKNLTDIATKIFGFSDCVDYDLEGWIEKWLYKSTACGAYIAFRDEGIALGSIVEGVDHQTEEHRLEYPFDTKDFDNAINSIEAEAVEIWNDTHGCEHCYSGEKNDLGYISVDPYCSSCNGCGTIL